VTETTPLPLAGTVVLDLTQVWAGPLCVQLLADFGADVIKLESRVRATELYATQARRRAVRGTAARSPALEACDSLFRNRTPLSLDISRPEGRALLCRLVEHADVLVENFTARLLREWELSYERLAAINPRLVMVSMSPAGHDGPWSGILTYGPTLSALYGAKALLGYPGDERPLEDMSEADPIAGVYGFYATLSALAQRDATGTGRHVDLAQGEAVLTHALEAILCEQTGAPPPRGNRHSAMAPQGIYRCAGDDEWIALTVEHDEDWATLTALIGRPELRAAFPDLDARLAAHDAIDAAIEAWTGARSAAEADALLSGAGLAAVPVLQNLEQFHHDHLRARRAVGLQVPAEVGDAAALANAMPIKLSATPARIRVGESFFDTPQTEPARALLGLDDGEIERLVATGVL
jgi:crotonobetainyl-CoA:carnitine CoA-transferase CaiB-like acyl-CoA transferase